MFSRLFGKRSQADSSPEQPRPLLVPTVKFDAAQVTDRIRADIEAAINGLPDIPKSKRPAIIQAAIHSVSVGRDLAVVARLIDESEIAGMTKARASAIARFVNNRAAALINQQRQLANGITTARWVHIASCVPYPRNATAEEKLRDELHQNADGKRFDVAKGMQIGERWTLPGYDEGCKCTSESIIPGFEDD
jgi:hypothetical protein